MTQSRVNQFYSLAIYIISLMLCQSAKSQDINKEILNWNKLTKKSLVAQTEKLVHLSEKKIYKDHLEVFMMNNDNKDSKRTQFLNEIGLSPEQSKDFYVIEANRSGEQVEIISHLICLNPDAFSNVYIYHYENRQWIRKPGIRKIQPNILTGDLSRFVTTSKQAINYDNVIITRFVNNTAMASEFYLYDTLSQKSGLKSLLELY